MPEGFLHCLNGQPAGTPIQLLMAGALPCRLAGVPLNIMRCET